MRDIRALILYKQHYLDRYDQPLTSQYSCLGYYDGMDIKEIKEGKMHNNLFEKQTQSPISELWYYAGKVTENLQGGYSCQTIGLIRCVDSEEEKAGKNTFWEETKKEPYFVIGFVKIKNGQEYERVGKEIENQADHYDKGERYCNILTYCTYDNADLVVLAHGNSVVHIIEKLKCIECMDDVVYLHSILGFSEEYLTACKNANTIKKYYNEENCFIEDNLKMINIRFAALARADLKDKLQEELKRWHNDDNTGYFIDSYDNITYSYVLGHESIEMDIPETTVRTLLTLLLPGGFLTHQNTLYNKFLYNIETFIQTKNENKTCGDLDTFPGKDKSKSNDDLKWWCRELILKYEKLAKEAFDKGDESLYSHFQSLIQTLNTLDQYERFELSREMFYLLYPALKMFENQLSMALPKDEENYQYHIEKIKNSLGQMVEYINSVVYHTVHTDQVYLMIPGYSGSSFSIPIKLNLLYLWFNERITQVLNDSGNEYSAILIPVSESRPMTSFLPFSLQERDRLICVKISQRFLFMPRALVVFLCHELSHYIGKNVRKRESRFGKVIKVLAYYIAEGIYKEEECNLKNKVACEWIKWVRETLMCRFLEFVTKVWDENVRKEYYGESIKLFLKKTIRSFLSSDEEAIAIIQAIPKIFFEETNDEEFLNGMAIIYRKQKIMEKNRRILSDSGLIDEIIDQVVLLFQEVFCDTVAKCILNFSLENFEEAFQVSEGIKMNASYSKNPLQWKVRHCVMEKVFFEEEKESQSMHTDDKSDNGQSISNARENNVMSLRDYMLSNINNFVWIRESLVEYANECKNSIQKRFDKGVIQDNNGKIKKVSDVITEIKTGYRLFVQNDMNCYDIYKSINQYINDYINRVNAQWKNVCVKNEDKNC